MGWNRAPGENLSSHSENVQTLHIVSVEPGSLGLWGSNSIAAPLCHTSTSLGKGSEYSNLKSGGNNTTLSKNQEETETSMNLPIYMQLQTLGTMQTRWNISPAMQAISTAAIYTQSALKGFSADISHSPSTHNMLVNLIHIHEALHQTLGQRRSKIPAALNGSFIS